jgi:hypothetical protein
VSVSRWYNCGSRSSARRLLAAPIRMTLINMRAAVMCLRHNAVTGLDSYENLRDAITAAASACPDPRLPS